MFEFMQISLDMMETILRYLLSESIVKFYSTLWNLLLGAFIVNEKNSLG